MKLENTTSPKEWYKKPTIPRAQWGQWLALAFLALAMLVTRRLGLSRLVTPDEHLWLNRSANFYMGLSKGELSWTRQSVHPGVTTMWAGVAGFIARYPQYLASGLDNAGPQEFDGYISAVKGVTPLQILVAGRIFLILGQTLVLLISFLYACRLVGFSPAFFGFLLIVFDPFHLALTRLLHVDGMLSNLMLLSLLALLNYGQKQRSRDLVVSATAAGLGLLTKLPAILMLPVAGLIIVYTFWKEADFQQNRYLSQLLKPIMRVFIAWVLVFVLVFIALWPAMWVMPVQTITSMVKLGRSQVVTEQGKELFFDGEIIPSGGFGIKQWYFYPLTYLWRSTPVVLVGLLLVGAALLRKHPRLSSPPIRLTLWSLLLFIGFFTFVMSLSAKKYDRYLLPVYAPLDMIAGVGWSTLAMALGGRRFPTFLRYTPYAIPLAAIALQASLALNAYPYYLSYYNPLVGGSRLAPQVMQIGWGEGLDQAAQYLNKKPGARNLKAISFLTSGCFSYYFEGREREMPYMTDRIEDDDDWQKFIDSDYAVIYISQWQRNISPPILEYVARLNPEHTVWINGLEYARIYKLH